MYFFVWRNHMSERRIILTHSNYIVLKGLVETLQRSSKMKMPHFARFAREMKEAIVMDSQTIPGNIITLHSRVHYTYIDTNKTSEAVIVFPAQLKENPDYVSILSPLGLALIGEQEGTVIEYEAPGGIYRLKIDRVEHLHSKFAESQNV